MEVMSLPPFMYFDCTVHVHMQVCVLEEVYNISLGEAKHANNRSTHVCFFKAKELDKFVQNGVVYVTYISGI